MQAVLENDIALSQIHYDITSIYFEGEYEESDTIDYGYSRDNRPDAKQLNLGVNGAAKQGFRWPIASWRDGPPTARRRWRTCTLWTNSSTNCNDRRIFSWSATGRCSTRQCWRSTKRKACTG